MSDAVGPADVLARRYAAQGLTGARPASATESVRRLACVQSQEHAHAAWSLGMRAAGLDHAAVRAELDAGSVVRTHILRPTWHYVAAEDVRWITAVTSGRVQQANGSVLRREGLDPVLVERGVRVVAEALADHTYLTRTELGKVLAAAGLPGQGFGQIYIVVQAELDAVITSGPLRGGTHTYALLDERVPRSLDADGDEAELARRFFVGHGPASVRDLARWSSLTLTSCRRAVQSVAARLASTEVDGTELWYDPETCEPGEQPPVLLLPLYDELTLSYLELGIPRATDHPHAVGADQFVGTVVADGTNLGLWRRVVKASTVEVELTLARSTTPAQRAGAEQTAADLAAFLGLDLVLTVSTP